MTDTAPAVDHPNVRVASSELDRRIEEYWPHAYRLAVAVLGRGADAEDAAQDAVVSFARSLPALRDPEALRAWGAAIAIRAARRLQRRVRARREDRDSPDRSYSEDTDTMLDLESALSAMRSDWRIPLVLHAVYGYTSNEISRIIGVPDGTVRYRIWCARNHVRRTCRDSGEGLKGPVDASAE
jgi:RNA polymerase sigma factor (sigma-70 family)